MGIKTHSRSETSSMCQIHMLSLDMLSISITTSKTQLAYPAIHSAAFVLHSYVPLKAGFLTVRAKAVRTLMPAPYLFLLSDQIVWWLWHMRSDRNSAFFTSGLGEDPTILASAVFWPQPQLASCMCWPWTRVCAVTMRLLPFFASVNEIDTTTYSTYSIVRIV